MCLFNKDLAAGECASLLRQLSDQVLVLKIEGFHIVLQDAEHGQGLGHSSAKQAMVLNSLNHAAKQNAFEQQKPTHESIDGVIFMSQCHDGCGSIGERVPKTSCQSIIVLINPCVSAHPPDSGSHLVQGELPMKRGEGTSKCIECGVADPCELES